MNITTQYTVWGSWYAVNEDSYDGLDDGYNNVFGYGDTEQEAIDDLKERLDKNICRIENGI